MTAAFILTIQVIKKKLKLVKAYFNYLPKTQIVNCWERIPSTGMSSFRSDTVMRYPQNHQKDNKEQLQNYYHLHICKHQAKTLSLVNFSTSPGHNSYGQTKYL